MISFECANHLQRRFSCSVRQNKLFNRIKALYCHFCTLPKAELLQQNVIVSVVSRPRLPSTIKVTRSRRFYNIAVQLIVHAIALYIF